LQKLLKWTRENCKCTEIQETSSLILFIISALKMLHLQSHLQAEHPDNIKLADEVLQSLKYTTRKPPSLTWLCNAQQTLHLVVLFLYI